MSRSSTIRFIGKRLFNTSSSRTFSTPAGIDLTQRKNLILSIYGPPFENHEKNSAEYMELARSGRVWEDHFQPYNSERLGFAPLQREHSKLIQKIDALKRAMKFSVAQLAKVLVSEYAHQSVVLEGNRLKLGDSEKILDVLERKFFSNIDIASAPVEDLLKLSLPDLHFIQYDDVEVAELTNHLIASYWIAESAVRHPRSAGLQEMQIRQLSALTNRNTSAEALYTKSWGRRIKLGDYRATPISVRSNPLRIFPYPIEVPALMERFLKWRNQAHEEQQLHPLILACQLIIYFMHIHPFPDGNGRVGRMLMHDYMVRQGFMPAVMQKLLRQDYLRMVSDAQDGKPQEFVLTVLLNQWEELQTFHFRENEF